jgi:hypothetical protein
MTCGKYASGGSERFEFNCFQKNLPIQFDTRIIGRTEKAEAFDLFWTE